MTESQRHVLPTEHGWQVEKEHAQRASATTDTQAEAITRATQIVANDGGGQVIIHSADGTVNQSRTVSADGHDTTPTSATTPPPRTATDIGSSPSELSPSAAQQPITTTAHAARHDPHTPTEGGERAHPRARRAAHHAVHRDHPQLKLPLLGTVALPAPDQLAYLGGITALLALGVVEWPIAAILGAGHLLAAAHNNKTLSNFGEALEQG